MNTVFPYTFSTSPFIRILIVRLFYVRAKRYLARYRLLFAAHYTTFFRNRYPPATFWCSP